jgi:putative protein-disulfide isomerase
MVSPTSGTRVVIVFDALCGWSYAAWPALEQVWETNRDRVPFDVISGGLFVGGRVQPIGAIDFIPKANRRITELTGAVFGDGYETLRSEGTYVLDSAPPAWRFAVLRSLAPDQAVPLAHDLQRRHYLDGAELDQPDVYEGVAIDAGLSPATLREAMDHADRDTLAGAEFSAAQALGVHAFPTVLLVHGDLVQVLAEGVPDPDQINAAIDAALTAGTTR